MTRIFPLALALQLAAVPVQASTIWKDGEHCGDAVQMIRALARRYGERAVGFEDIGTGRAKALFVSEAGTWTIAILEGHGACVVEAGEDWELPTTWAPGI